MNQASASNRLYSICIGVLTKNEARRIDACLQSARFADQLIVVDSGSTDETLAIAAKHPAEIHVYDDWQGFGEQRNRLLEHCRCDYIFFLDADEVITPEFQAELLAAVTSGASAVGEIKWMQVAYGRELKHIISRNSLPRFFKRSTLLRYEGFVHEGAVLTDPQLPHFVFKALVPHYSRETIHDSLKKLTQYAMLGAAKRAGTARKGGVWIGGISAFFVFTRMYIFKLAFLEGGPGFLYSLFVALEFFFRQAALKYDRPYLSQNIGR